ncbi:hypothetical protein ACJIZ3_006181 [Penstemon smallii]|uniref:Uncharacterized protein n=1 Tax=Penstemon smallii TaxID=265156 RepID=A0ABD3S747_9LAMI
MLNGGLRGQMIVQSLCVLDWKLQNSELGSVNKSSPYHRSFHLHTSTNLGTVTSCLFLKLSLKRRSKELIISILNGVIHMDMEKESVWELIFWSWKEYNAWFGVMKMHTR